MYKLLGGKLYNSWEENAHTVYSGSALGTIRNLCTDVPGNFRKCMEDGVKREVNFGVIFLKMQFFFFKIYIFLYFWGTLIHADFKIFYTDKHLLIPVFHTLWEHPSEQCCTHEVLVAPALALWKMEANTSANRECFDKSGLSCAIKPGDTWPCLMHTALFTGSYISCLCRGRSECIPKSLGNRGEIFVGEPGWRGRRRLLNAFKTCAFYSLVILTV